MVSDRNKSLHHHTESSEVGRERAVEMEAGDKGTKDLEQGLLHPCLEGPQSKSTGSLEHGSMSQLLVA